MSAPPPGGHRPAVAAGVPAYFHPAWAAADWRALAERPGPAVVVVNPDTGPGSRPDPAYRPVLAAVAGAGARVAGYVDTDYGRRPARLVLTEVGRYRDWYGLDALFLDRVASAVELLDHYRALVRAARSAGVRWLALNPGTVPHPDYLDLADLVVLFEDTWERYREWRPPAWVGERAAGRAWHLVHTVPPDRLAEAAGLAARRGAAVAHLTDGVLPNPWDRLPVGWGHR